MSALGQKRSFVPVQPNVRFAPEADIPAAKRVTPFLAGQAIECGDRSNIP
jgi:hypothetical protein